MNIYNVKILDLLPPNLKSDPDIIAASQAVDTEFTNMANYINNVRTFVGMDKAATEVIDNLAEELHTDFYDASLPLATRRALAKGSILRHMLKGTPAAVEELIETVFGSGEVLEWWEYDGGEPYHFKVRTLNKDATTTQAVEFTRALDSVKNCRSWCDGVEITQSEDMPLYFAGILHMGDKLILRQVM